MEVEKQSILIDDIVSTLGEIPRKFIRELYEVTIRMKIFGDER